MGLHRVGHDWSELAHMHTPYLPCHVSHSRINYLSNPLFSTICLSMVFKWICKAWSKRYWEINANFYFQLLLVVQLLAFLKLECKNTLLPGYAKMTEIRPTLTPKVKLPIFRFRSILNFNWTMFLYIHLHINRLKCILASYCCYNNGHKFSGLKQHSLWSDSSVEVSRG